MDPLILLLIGAFTAFILDTLNNRINNWLKKREQIKFFLFKIDIIFTKLVSSLDNLSKEVQKIDRFSTKNILEAKSTCEELNILINSDFSLIKNKDLRFDIISELYKVFDIIKEIEILEMPLEEYETLQKVNRPLAVTRLLDIKLKLLEQGIYLDSKLNGINPRYINDEKKLNNFNDLKLEHAKNIIEEAMDNDFVIENIALTKIIEDNKIKRPFFQTQLLDFKNKIISLNKQVQKINYR